MIPSVPLALQVEVCASRTLPQSKSQSTHLTKNKARRRKCARMQKQCSLGRCFSLTAMRLCVAKNSHPVDCGSSNSPHFSTFSPILLIRFFSHPLLSSKPKSHIKDQEYHHHNMSGDGNKKATRSSTRGKPKEKEETTAASDTAAAAKGKDKETTTATSSKKDTKDSKKDSSKDTKAAVKEEAGTSKKEAAAAVKKEDDSEAAEAKKDSPKDKDTKAVEGDDKKGETEKKNDTAPKDKTAASKTEEDADEDKDGKHEEGIPADGVDPTTPSKEVIRTVYWPAAERRYDEITIEDDFEFDDETQTITGICEKPPRHFPNTHFMRRLAGHLRLGLGRNATKEAILEKICQAKYGAAFTRPPVEDETSSSKKRRASDAAAASTVLKKRPVIMKSGGSGKRASVGGASSAVEATLKARAAALTAVSSSLDTLSTTIRQAEERLQKLCEAAKVDFYVALMDRSKLTNDYLRTHFAEYDDFLKTQKDMIASITELSKGNDLKGPISTAGASTTTPAGKAAGTPAAGGVAAMTVGIAIPSGSAPPDPDEVTNHMEV